MQVQYTCLVYIHLQTEDTASKSEDATDGEVAPPKDLEYLSKVINLKRAYVQFSVDEERTEIENVKRHFAVELDKFECNMRKYYIVGGVYHVSLLKQPPQPKVLRDGAVIRLIEGKDGLQRWPYSETYEPPTIKASGPVKQPTDDDDEDAENTPEGEFEAERDGPGLAKRPLGWTEFYAPLESE